MLKINELKSYLKNKGVPEDSYSIKDVYKRQVFTLAVVSDAGIWVYSKVQANSKSQAKKRA